MTQFKGTPGPWRVSEKRGDLIDIRHENNEPGAMSLNLAQVVARQSWLKEAEANARLIAAAPELLQALQNLMLNYSDFRERTGRNGDPQNPLILAALAAINKATGETK